MKYYDGESWVTVEDNNDLELAFTYAQGSNKKLTFNIKHPNCASTIAVEERKNKKDKREKKEKKPKIISKKALKNVIAAELEKQAPGIFTHLFK